MGKIFKSFSFVGIDQRVLTLRETPDRCHVVVSIGRPELIEAVITLDYESFSELMKLDSCSSYGELIKLDSYSSYGRRLDARYPEKPIPVEDPAPEAVTKPETTTANCEDSLS